MTINRRWYYVGDVKFANWPEGKNLRWQRNSRDISFHLLYTVFSVSTRYSRINYLLPPLVFLTPFQCVRNRRGGTGFLYVWTTWTIVKKETQDERDFSGVPLSIFFFILNNVQVGAISWGCSQSRFKAFYLALPPFYPNFSPFILCFFKAERKLVNARQL